MPEPIKSGNDAGNDCEALPELNATQYVILAESQRKKRALMETRIKYNALLEENKRLLREREESEKAAFEVTETMRRDILTKNDRIAELESSLADQKASYEAQLRQVTQKMEAGISQKNLQLQELEGNYQEQVDSLKKELKDVEQFCREKEELEKDRLRMHAENDSLQNKLEEVERQQEHNFIQGTMRLKKEYEQKMEELTKRYEEDMDERLDVSIRRIVQQNKRTAMELQLHVEESSMLQQENKVLMEDRRTLQRELELKLQMEKEFANRGAKQSRAIKASDEKVVALERALQGFVEDFEKERAHMRKQWEKAAADMAAEVDAYRRLAELKAKEAKNVRRLAQEVLLQRSDTEIFFLSSLEHVRKELELEAKRATGAPQGRSTPPRSGRVDIGELTWAERERVLRLAFAKMNNQTRSLKYMQLPAHPRLAGRQKAQESASPLSGVVSGAEKPHLA
eukprot:jgi/Ulvmu1/1056/UM105_0014.1